MSGRTSWYAEDAALHRRELVVELRAEHGGGAVNVYRTLRDLSQEQLKRNLSGCLLTGFRSLAEASGVAPDDCRKYVGSMVSLGLLDEYEEREDGRRFTCRVSGWRADQNRGGETLRKRDQRANSEVDTPGQDGTEAGHVPPCPTNQTIDSPNQENDDEDVASRANLPDTVAEIVSIFDGFGQQIAQESVENAIARFPSLSPGEVVQTARGCAQSLAESEEAKPVGSTFHRWLENEARKTSEIAERQKDDAKPQGMYGGRDRCRVKTCRRELDAREKQSCQGWCSEHYAEWEARAAA